MITGSSMHEIFFTRVMLDDLRGELSEQALLNATKQTKSNQVRFSFRRSLGQSLKRLGERLDPQPQRA
jgi:hypothetical protein